MQMRRRREIWISRGTNMRGAEREKRESKARRYTRTVIQSYRTSTRQVNPHPSPRARATKTKSRTVSSGMVGTTGRWPEPPTITLIPKHNREPSRTDAQPNGTLADHDTVNGARAPLRVRGTAHRQQRPNRTRGAMPELAST